jgi:glycosyltransferase involved in cell wall biosynthesis
MNLSIITVNLNNAAGLRKTIESVVKQSFSDFEYIVIDGGSTEVSKEVIEGYNDKIEYWISEKDTGIYNAMNKGIRRATGEYCLFLNSGDFLVNEDVLKAVFMQSFSEDIVVGDCFISQDGEIIFRATPPDAISFSAFYTATIPHQSAFIKRSLFEKYGYYSEQYRIHSDLEFFIKTLIVNNCSYRHLTVTVSDYNMEGISGREENKAISIMEGDEILRSHVPSRIIADYASWTAERKELGVYYWVKSKPLLYKPLVWIYHLATFLVSLKKKILNQ